MYKKKKIIGIGVAIAALFVAIIIANAYSTPSFESKISNKDESVQESLLDSINKLNINLAGLADYNEHVIAERDSLRDALPTSLDKASVAQKDQIIKEQTKKIKQLEERIKQLEAKKRNVQRSDSI